MKQIHQTKFEIFYEDTDSSGFTYHTTYLKFAERARSQFVKKNLEEGRGFRFGKGATRGGDFDFASSNPLWRSAVEVLDFVPLTNASYSCLLYTSPSPRD